MSQEHIILGLNAYHGDSSAAILGDGQLLHAVEEERFNRIKHWAGLPCLAARDCVERAGVGHISHVAISRDPKVHFFSKVKRVAIRPSHWRRAVSRAANSIRVTQVLDDLEAAGLDAVKGAQLHHVEHHRAHLASTFFASPFEEAAIISIDGFGDFSSLMWGVGQGNRFDVRGATRFPHSLGLFYTAFTQLLGFPKYGDEYKMMGLSAYGEPRFAEQVRKLIRTDDDQCR